MTGKKINDSALIKRSGNYQLLPAKDWDEKTDKGRAKCPECKQQVHLHFGKNKNKWHFEHKKGDKKFCRNKVKSEIFGPIIKLENVAEALVSKFFDHFLKSNYEIEFPAYDFKMRQQGFIRQSQISDILGKKIKVIPQFRVDTAFEVSKKVSTNRSLIINPISCFDCSLIGKGTILPIEVKSGSSGKYNTIKRTLENSLNKNAVSISDSLKKEFLKGDMISILSNRVKRGSKLEYLDYPLLQSKPSSKLKLHPAWILIVQTNKQIRNFKGDIPAECGLAYIMSLEEIISYLRKKKQLKTFEKTLLKDFHKVIKLG